MHDLGHVARVRHRVRLVDIVVLLQESLKLLIRALFVAFEAKDFKSLFLGNESSLDSQPLLSNLLPALIGKLLSSEVLPFPEEEAHDFLLSLKNGECPDHPALFALPRHHGVV